MGSTQRETTGRSGQYSDYSPTFVFTSPDVLTTTDNALIPWLPGLGTLITKIEAQVKTAPVGSAITVDIKVYDRATATLVTTLATVTIADGAFQGSMTITPAYLLLTTQVLAAEITAVGSGTAGSNLTTTVRNA